ncbi:hypothetical protein J8J40_23210, partial [Mycobacterium tuberculosis]|nr:hypothetical protein [Mycobacterium tuberculosis]
MDALSFRACRSFRHAVFQAAGFLALSLAIVLATDRQAAAQEVDPGILPPGTAAVSGFSGTITPGAVPPGADPAAQIVIDPNAPALRIFDLRALGGPADGRLLTAPTRLSVAAAAIGQVFGLAID